MCADDILAAGVYAAAAQLGLSIPRQLSVVGYGGTIVGEVLQPALTTVLTPAEELGVRGVQLLIEHLQGREITAAHRRAGRVRSTGFGELAGLPLMSSRQSRRPSTA